MDFRSGVLWLSVAIIGAPSVQRTDLPALPPIAEGQIAADTPRLFIVRAKAGDVISGSIDFTGEVGSFSVSEPNGATIKAFDLEPGENDIGFTAETAGSYRIEISVPSGIGKYRVQTTQRTPAERAAATVVIPPTIPYESTSVAKLRDELQKHEAGALPRFWSAVEAAHGPIIEDIPGDPNNALVTFVWREAFKTHHVRLDRPPYSGDYYLVHLKGTDVWYRTMKVMKRSRFQYTFQPNYLASDGAATSTTDPMNPRVYPAGAPRFASYASSVLELPAAPDESWASKTPTRRGAIVDRVFDSPTLKAELKVKIYTPADYKAGAGQYPLVVLFDGPAYSGVMDAPKTLDNLVAAGLIRPPVVCFTSSSTSGADRARNLRFNPTFADAIANELVPWLRSSFAISRRPEDAVIGGFSAGANAGFYIALRHPDIFGNVLSQDGGAGIGHLLPQMLLDAPKGPIRVYMDQSAYELRVESRLPFDEMAVSLDLLATAVRLRDVLRAKGYDVVYRDVGGAHDPLHFRATLAEALIALLSPLK